MEMSRAAIFFDRDGTLNVDTRHLYRIEDWRWIPGAKSAIRRFKAEGFLVIVVTNQSGIARGLYTAADVNRLHETINNELRAEGVEIDGFYFCPHHPDFGRKEICDCRKPNPGMLYSASIDHDIDLKSSWMIGDKLNDMTAGLTAGTRAVLVGDAAEIERVKLVSDQRAIILTSISAATHYVMEYRDSFKSNIQEQF